MNTYTSLAEIEQLLLDKQVRLVTIKLLATVLPGTNLPARRAIINRLLHKRRIRRLKRGMYEFVQKPLTAFEKANVMISPSYVSLESALNYYGILAQFPHVITSMTPKHSKTLNVDQTYEYSQIQPALFTDFVKDQQFLIASPEKAVADWCYLAGKGLRSGDVSQFDFESLDLDLLCTNYPWTQSYVKFSSPSRF